MFVAEKEARAMAFENPQTQTGAVYAGGQSNYGVVDASQPYYQVFYLCICFSMWYSGFSCCLIANFVALL
jgi:hypothetical protein